jgi:hypothetical protein
MVSDMMLLTDRDNLREDVEKDVDAASEETSNIIDSASCSSRELKPPPMDGSQDALICESCSNGAKALCSKCQKRRAKLSCCEMSCLYCCTSEQCEGHSSYRSGQMLQRQMLDGTHWCVKLATELRAKAVKKGAFKEKAIHYLEETCLVWDIDQFEKLADGKNERVFRGRSNFHGTQSSTANSSSAAAGEVMNTKKIISLLASKRQRLERRRALRFQKFLEKKLKDQATNDA